LSGIPDSGRHYDDDVSSSSYDHDEIPRDNATDAPAKQNNNFIHHVSNPLLLLTLLDLRQLPHRHPRATCILLLRCFAPDPKRRQRRWRQLKDYIKFAEHCWAGLDRRVGF
jgi:hypothetical protein